MPKAPNIHDQTTAFVKKSLIIPFLMEGIGFISYAAKNTGRAQLITKILGDEPIGSMRSMPLRGGVVLELDIRSESLTLYECTQQDIYYPASTARKELFTLPIVTPDDVSAVHRKMLPLYYSHCYDAKELLALFAGSVFEPTLTKLVKHCFYAPGKPRIACRNVTFAENGVLLEAGSGVTYFRMKITPNGTCIPVLYRYELSKTAYFQSMESLENYKDPSFLGNLYEHHQSEKYILNNRKVEDALSSFYTESVLLTA